MKSIKVILLLLLALSVVGCQTTSNKNINEDAVLEQTTKRNPYKLGENSESSLKVKDEYFESSIIHDISKESNVQIHYPSFDGQNISIIDMLNEEIENEVLTNVRTKEIFKQSNVSYEVTYSWFANENMISIVFQEIFIIDGSVSNSISTLNFNLMTGKRVKAVDIFNVNNNLIDYLFDEPQIDADRKDPENQIRTLELGKDNLVLAMKQGDSKGLNERKSSKDFFSYYTSDSVVFVFVHDIEYLGNYYRMRVPYDKLQAYLK